MTTIERLLILAYLVVMFVIDSQSPLGFLTWLLYIPAVLYFSFRAKRREVILLTSLTSSLTIIGFFLSPPGMPPFIAGLNRAFDIAVLWGLSLFSLWRNKIIGKISESEENLRTIFDSSNDAIFVHDPDGKIIDVNRKGLEMYRVSRQQALSLSIKDFFSSNNQLAEVPEIWDRVAGGENILLEWKARRPKDDSVFEVEVYLTRMSLKERTAILATVKDVTRRKQMEKDLRLTQFLIEHASICAYILGRDAQFLYVNEQTCRTLGYTREELLSMAVYDIDPDFPASVWEEHWADLKKMSGLHFETNHKRKDGTLVPIELNLNYIAFGGREYNVAFGLDITERRKSAEALQQAYADLEIKVEERTRDLGEANNELRREVIERQRAEEALRASEKRIRDLIEATNDWVWEIDSNGIYTYASPQVKRMLGYEPEEVLGKTIFDLMPPEEAERLRGIAEEIADSQQPFSLLENISLHKNGTRIVLESSGVPFFDASGSLKGYRGIHRDVTERKKTEQELLKAQRIESIGLLAGGIAHDFNNILTAILGNIELVRMFLPPEEKPNKRLAVAEEAAIRARGITQQLLTFSKGGAPIKQVFSVPPLFQNGVEFSLRGTNVKSDFHFPPDLCLVEADENQLRQVISNLTINAVQAMPEGGTLTVSASNETIPAQNTLDLRKGKYVRIDLTDQGGGIPKEHLGQIFDPYYTTKEKGSGLGLAISFSIMKRHGGTITVKSVPGKGSTFSLFLPASEEQGVSPEEPVQMEAFSGQGRILVMDDEKSVQEIATDMLQHLGYRAEKVKNGAEAVEAYRDALNSGDPFDVVITDLTIPDGMGGRETVRHLRELDSGAKVVASSGYANDPIMSDYPKYGFAGVLAKPYKIRELGKTLEDVIRGKK